MKKAMKIKTIVCNEHELFLPRFKHTKAAHHLSLRVRDDLEGSAKDLEVIMKYR